MSVLHKDKGWSHMFLLMWAQEEAGWSREREHQGGWRPGVRGGPEGAGWGMEQTLAVHLQGCPHVPYAGGFEPE